MKHGAVRKLMRATTLSLLVFGMTSGVVGLEVMAASPAMAQPGDQSGGSNEQGGSGGQGGGSGSGSDSPLDKLIGGVTGNGA
jgi:hypothetical protein